eukprot:2358756-Amphidinium_carterae.1
MDELKASGLLPCKGAPLWKAYDTGSWLDRPPTYHEAVRSLRALLKGCSGSAPELLTIHSLKATVLAWSAHAGLGLEDR